MTKLFIREAELSDWLPVRDLMIEIHDKAPYGEVPYTVNDAMRAFKLAVVAKNRLTLVVTDKKHRIYGLLIATTSINWWGVKVATELVSYCTASGWMPWLLRRYKKWAADQGVKIISVVNSSGQNDRYEKLIEKLGFTRAGAAFMAFPQES